MSYMFLRSGLMNGMEDITGDKEVLTILMRLLEHVVEKCLQTSVFFAQACGRTHVTGRDMMLTLQYHAHEVVGSQEYVEVVNQACDDARTNLTESVGADVEDDENEGEDDEDDHDGDDRSSISTVDMHDEGDSIELSTECSDALAELHRRILGVDATWNEWEPSDVRQQLMKRAIEKTKEAFAVK